MVPLMIVRVEDFNSNTGVAFAARLRLVAFRRWRGIGRECSAFFPTVAESFFLSIKRKEHDELYDIALGLMYTMLMKVLLFGSKGYLGRHFLSLYPDAA